MTQKDFKLECNDQTYTGWNGKRIRINAFFFDYKSGTTKEEKRFAGYQFMVNANVKDCTKAELLKEFYKWVTSEGEHHLPWWINYRYAETDLKRFKISLSM
jgi:hypothetical protein